MIILLNGTSSSGKSSIAKELLRQLSEPYFFFSVDQFLEPAMPSNFNMDVEQDIKVIDRAISGFNSALGAYSDFIDFMVIDHVLQRQLWLKEVAKSLERTDVFFVGITAPLKILEEREKLRPDRQPGTAKSQFDVISSYQYDLIVDTSVVSSSDGATKIINNLKKGSGLSSSVNNAL